MTPSPSQYELKDKSSLDKEINKGLTFGVSREVSIYV